MHKVAYLGPKGTFSEEAAHQYFCEQTEWVMYASIPDVLEAVQNEVVDKCIVPIENSIAGNIHMTIDGLLMHKLHIEADLIFTVSLHLLTAAEAHIDSITTVTSILPTINQCREFIQQKHLQILKSNIQDHSANHTRFIVVGKNTPLAAEQQKTMLLITPNNEYPGVLGSILNVFTALNINLTWIESRPTGQKLGTYRFLMETEVTQEDPRMIKVLRIFATFEHEVHIVGSYSTKIL
jgi:prephenate dehydratase